MNNNDKEVITTHLVYPWPWCSVGVAGAGLVFLGARGLIVLLQPTAVLVVVAPSHVVPE